MKRIIVALPTCGKTYACGVIKHLKDKIKAVDFDIKGSKSLLTDEVRDAQTMYVKAVFSAGCDLLFTHNGAINWNLLNPSEYEVDVVIRDCSAKQYVKLIKERGDSKEFAEYAALNFDRWVDDMWKLFDQLSDFGFKTRVILLGTKRFIMDYLEDELYIMVALRTQERK